MTELSERLGQRDLMLPAPPKPGGHYSPVIVDGGVGCVAGQLPLRDGVLVASGHVGDSVTLDEARDCARVCVLNLLAALAGSLDPELASLRRVLRLTVFVASAPDFHQQPAVADAASELLVHALGEPARHARSAVGVAALPRGAPVMIDAIVRVS